MKYLEKDGSVNEWVAPTMKTEQPPTKVGGLVINGLKVRIRVG
ncbi:hypothetical protein QL112_004460 [Xenorhabdus griffiniae]|uniref:Uncharacterized protein n=1 Tax=Xenorhabdus griffiniae TaxID=351672 RepID=A0ABY9XK33_9GAMM|nr:hypothetical protein [Xenorhabdus griffiniae]WMV73297.1 hypothetical protein QL128_04455 [Xenorhabdus griffiniae]WNH02976.1 hypothetical protein QL112_004460 [Xenorhabdus griffiniae]